MISLVTLKFCCSFFRAVHLGIFSTGFFLLLVMGGANATEWSLDSSLRVHYEYNDNIFLTLDPHESVSNVLIQPDINFRIEEKSWETLIKARLKNNNYSDSNLDSNDQYYMVDVKYQYERGMFSLKGTYDLKSNLDTESSDFGISATRINRTTTDISPSYSYMLTERLQASLSYTMLESKYDDLVGSGFVPYEVDMSAISLVYGLSEKNKINASVQYTDYLSLDGLSEYQSLALRMGVTREFSETFKSSFSIGTSERDSISRSTGSIDFFGTTVALVQENDFNNSGIVLDLELDLKTELGAVTGQLSRDTETSSYGGVDEVNLLSLGYTRKISDYWSFSLDGKYTKTEAIMLGASFTDRDLLTVDTKINYFLDKDWKITTSWRYQEREFSTQNQNYVPHSNRFYIGMTYSSSKLSTF